MFLVSRALRTDTPAKKIRIPDFFRGPLDYGIVRRARETELIEILIQDLRAFTHDRHRTVDDRPFGGAKAWCLSRSLSLNAWSRWASRLVKTGYRWEAAESVILLSPQGRLFTQAVAQEMMSLERIVLICGRYEGVDERVSEHLADREISVGDFVLSGGELGAAIIVDTLTRLVPGALGNAASSQQESFTANASESP